MIFYITTHEKNIEQAKVIKAVFEKTDYEYYFVYGKGNTLKLEPYIEVNCNEVYENLPLKTYYITEHFIKSDHDYMMKMDDDTYVDLNKLKNTTFTEDYIGMFLNHTVSAKNSIFHWYKIKTEEFKVQKPVFDMYYAEGGGYFLSKKAAHAIYDAGEEFFINTPSTYMGEDVKVGMCLAHDDIIKKNLMNNCKLFYEMADDCLIIHPVHTAIYNRLVECETEEGKRQILMSNNFLNTNVKREAYLTKILKEQNITI